MSIDEHILISSSIHFLEEQFVGYLYNIWFILHTFCVQGTVGRQQVLVTLFKRKLILPIMGKSE